MLLMHPICAIEKQPVAKEEFLVWFEMEVNIVSKENNCLYLIEQHSLYQPKDILAVNFFHVWF